MDRFTPHHRRALFVLACVLATPSCTAQRVTRYPSLLPRAIETRSDAEPEVTAAVAAPDPAADTVVAALRRSLDQTVAAFNPAAAAAERLAAAAGGDRVGGDRWIAAQTALGDLDGYRATTSSIVSDLDTLALDRAADGKSAYPAVTALHDAAQAALDAQAARIAAISARLPGA